jgi:hypothetical protein
VDCVGVCERDMTDSRPMDQKKSVPLDEDLEAALEQFRLIAGDLNGAATGAQS